MQISLPRRLPFAPSLWRPRSHTAGEEKIRDDAPDFEWRLNIGDSPRRGDAKLLPFSPGVLTGSSSRPGGTPVPRQDEIVTYIESFWLQSLYPSSQNIRL